MWRLINRRQLPFRIYNLNNKLVPPPSANLSKWFLVPRSCSNMREEYLQCRNGHFYCVLHRSLGLGKNSKIWRVAFQEDECGILLPYSAHKIVHLVFFFSGFPTGLGFSTALAFISKFPQQFFTRLETHRIASSKMLFRFR